MVIHKKSSGVTPISAELISLFRDMVKNTRNAHPEIWSRWRDIVGTEIARRAFPQSLKGRVLTIGVVNSSWMQELTFLKYKILDSLVEAVGPSLVNEIRFVLNSSKEGKRFVRSSLSSMQTDSAVEPEIIDLDEEIKKSIDKIEDEELKLRIQKAVLASLSSK